MTSMATRSEIRKRRDAWPISWRQWTDRCKRDCKYRKEPGRVFIGITVYECAHPTRLKNLCDYKVCPRLRHYLEMMERRNQNG
jgi:hypothetical protein